MWCINKKSESYIVFLNAKPFSLKTVLEYKTIFGHLYKL